ncbi:MAG: glycosyltransferase [Gallionella sp.]|jgi:glycosyltransferase involved in cell wall biosynthesis
MKLLHLIPSLNPDYGGVVSTVLLSTVELNAMGHETEILTLDTPDSFWLKEVQTKVYALGPALGTFGYSARLVPWLKAHAHEYDALIVNGLWQYVGFAAWRALKDSSTPYFVFTHGMLDPWFKYFYPLKHLKKWLYWPWAEYRVLRDARRVIFTCEEERLLARESFWLYCAKEAMVPLGVPVPPADDEKFTTLFLATYPELQGKRILLFLSRIHEKKGCDLLLEAFAMVAHHHDDRLHLVVAGPDQAGWVKKLQSRAATLGIASRITWPGMLKDDMKWGAFYAAEVFCLPSHHENFGIVVVEALACGKPVLISNKVQIWHEIVKDGAGLVDDDTLEGMQRLLNRWLSMSSADFSIMETNTLLCFQKRFQVQCATERLLELIEDSK